MSMWIGQPEDWGLSPAKLRILQAELDDHLDCLQADEGIPAADRARTEITKPKNRRRLAGPYLTDQVYATLHRWPTRREWRELIFLLSCFGVILVSDWLAIQVSFGWNDLSFERYQAGSQAIPPHLAWVNMEVAAWLLMAVGRAAFFTGFAYTLWRAWRLGWGVLLARILQLKLIHTVLVITAFFCLGPRMYSAYYDGYGYLLNWPQWLTAPVLLAVGLVSAIAVLIASRRRAWAWSLAVALTAVFLYAGGPLTVVEMQSHQSISYLPVRAADGSTQFVPNNDSTEIAERAAYCERWLPNVACDAAHNKMTITYYDIRPLAGAFVNRGRLAPSTAEELARQQRKVDRTEAATGNLAVAGPEAAPCGGIGWLSLPIPLLGLLGLIGLVVIMGRRGPAEFATYTAICVLAIIATILPFFAGQPISHLVELSPLAMLHTPLPGFETLLTYIALDWDWISLVGGLVLSAGVPWLLTAWFLKPAQAELPPADLGLAE
ncbi:hypothetical protein JW859_11675 [bacterium]|nr:hypothetical protein [bacterium]